MVEGSIDHLSEVISHVVAPSFLLSAVAGFISILMARLNTCIDRLRFLNAIVDEAEPRQRLRSDIPRQRRRVRLLHRSILFAVFSGVVATVLIIVAFAAALMGVTHVWAVAILFVISLSLLFVSLGLFAMEVRIGLSEFDHH